MEDLVSPDSVKAVLEKAVLSENEGATKIIIESMKLVYYDKGGEVIEPAIHVQGKTVHATKDAEGKTKEDTFPYDTVIPLLKSSRMKFPYDHSGLDKKADAGDNANNATEIKKSEDEVDKR